jgi:hypothetical protein
VLGNATDPVRAGLQRTPGKRGAAAAVCTRVNDGQDANAATRQAASDWTVRPLRTAAAMCGIDATAAGVVLVF